MGTAAIMRATATALLVAVAACSAASDDSIVLPVGDAQQARELQLGAVPAVVRVTREEFAASSEKSANESSEESLRTLRDTYGRLGFFPMTFDPRSTARATSAFYGATYSNVDKTITVVDSAPTSLLVHELTHALQDQHFDLARLKKTARSSDEALAIRALIEGDAVTTTDRYLVWTHGEDPASTVAYYVTPQGARADSEKMLSEATVPLFFVALTSFAYSIGEAYLANLLQVSSGRWSYLAVNELFAGNGPPSTQAVIRAGIDVDPILPTGLGTLPADAAAEYAVSVVDRIGEYYTYLLFHRLGTPAELRSVTSAWDGDQLVVLHRKDDGPSGIVWTSIWDDEPSALAVQLYLLRLHGGPSVSSTSPEESYAYTAADGETVRVERRGVQVCFVKNLAPALAEHVANVALSTKEERRIELVNVVATLPIAH